MVYKDCGFRGLPAIPIAYTFLSYAYYAYKLESLLSWEVVDHWAVQFKFGCRFRVPVLMLGLGC